MTRRRTSFGVRCLQGVATPVLLAAVMVGVVCAVRVVGALVFGGR